MSKTTSNGGSSDYYKVKLPKSILKDNGDGTVTIEAGDIIRYALGNDFNLGNIFKALIRWGKKEGVDYQYDRNKIVYFADDHIRANTVPEKELTPLQNNPWRKSPGFMPCCAGSIVEVRRDDPRFTTLARADNISWIPLGRGSDVLEWRYAVPT